MKEANHELLVV